jgi:superfamily II DNA or RNA helicase
MKLKFSNDKSKIILTEASNREIHQLKLWLIRYAKNYRFMQKFKLGVWDGKIDHFKDGYIRFGLWQEVYKCCKEYEYKFDIPKEDFPFDNKITIDNVQKFSDEFYHGYRTLKTKDDPEGKEFKPYDHQINSVFKMLKYKFGLIEVATAGGKSLIFGTFLFYYLKNINPNGKILLVVPNVSLVLQFHDDILDYNFGYNKENKNPFDLKIHEIMSDKPRKYRGEGEPNIYIGTYQSIEKYPETWLRQFDIVVTDEAHTCTAITLEKILSTTFGSAKYRLGMSGTYPNEESAEFLSIISLMGPKLLTVGSKVLREKNIISDVKIKIILLNHNDQRFADSISVIKKSGNGQKAYQLEKDYIQASSLRREFIFKLVNRFEQNSLLLFYNVDYGEIMFNYLKDNLIKKDLYYIDGGTSSDKRSHILKEMEKTDGNTKILCASFGTLSTGINVKAISNIVFMDSFKSDRIIRQSIGRGLRLHFEKRKLHVFDLVDIFHKTYKNTLYKHYESRRDEIYKKQEFPYDEMKIVL